MHNVAGWGAVVHGIVVVLSQYIQFLGTFFLSQPIISFTRWSTLQIPTLRYEKTAHAHKRRVWRHQLPQAAGTEGCDSASVQPHMSVLHCPPLPPFLFLYIHTTFRYSALSCSSELFPLLHNLAGRIRECSKATALSVPPPSRRTSSPTLKSEYVVPGA